MFLDFWNALSGAEKLYVAVIIAYIPIMLFGIIASISVHTTFKRYNRTSSSCGMTAAEVARRMLDENGLSHVSINRTSGHLTDHFDPRSGSISLSDSVYGSTSVGAIGVACHEVGHAIQHDKGYLFSKLRLTMVPVLNITNKLIFPLLLIGFLLSILSSFAILTGFEMVAIVIIYFAVILFGLSTVFCLVTLPTEFNASSRAKQYLYDVLPKKEISGSSKVLKAAAMTYVAAFLMSLVQFLYYLARLLILVNNTRKR